MRAPSRVLIADDDPAIQSALADLLSQDPALELVGVATDPAEAVELAARSSPDLVLIDVKMSGGGGRRATREIRKVSPRSLVLALSAYDDQATVVEMLRAGASGYLVKGTPGRAILQGIHRALEGGVTLSHEAAASVFDALNDRVRDEESDRISREEATARVRRALSREGLQVIFQPIVRLADGTTVGAEALARFSEPSSRPPNAWFEEAHAVGLGTELEIAAIKRGLESLPEFPPDVYISVNVSPQVAASAAFRDALTEVSAARVVLEVTEHAAVEDYEALARALREPRAGGLRLAVDDAGAGFASLQHVLRLAPEIIKLDISITRGIDGSAASRSLAAAMVAFAREIRATIVAEGVETPEELRALRDLGIDHGQGYLLGRPAPLPLLAQV